MVTLPPTLIETPPPPPPPPPPPSALGYAGDSSICALPASIRASLLLVPNVIAAAVLFLHLHSDDAPIEPIIDYARQLLRLGPPSATSTWEAMITGPFLLAIPLALWTVRLTVAPRPRAAEGTIAWSLTLISLVMTGLCVGYCLFLRQPRFLLPIFATLVVVGVGVTCVRMLWRVRRAWPAALLAMTAAWSANTTLAALVVLSHQPWRAGTVVGLLVVPAQLVLMLIAARKWRAFTLTSG